MPEQGGGTEIIMKKGIRLHDVSGEDIKDSLNKCKKMGIDYLQFVPEKSILGFEFGKFTREYAEEIKDTVKDFNIAVLGSYINPSAPEDGELEANIAKFKEKIKYASVLKPIVVGTETGIFIEGKTHTEEAYQRVLNTMKILAKEAEKYNVCIGIEGVSCFVINTPEKAARLIRDLNTDNVKVIFDPVNLITYENYKNQDKIITDMFSLCGDKIAVIHAKDFVAENGGIRLVTPGEGMLDYNLIFAKLREYGLDIPIISEELDEKKAEKGFSNLSKF